MASYIPVLLRTYLADRDYMARVSSLVCLSAVADKRMLGFYQHVLDTESDEFVQLQAATALAQWNARSGIEGLAALLSSKKVLGERPLAAEAMAILFRLNQDREWGGPLKSMLEQRPTQDVSEVNQAAQALYQEVQAWFAANKDRFPVIPAEELDDWRAMLSPTSGPATPPSPSSGAAESTSHPVQQPATRSTSATRPTLPAQPATTRPTTRETQQPTSPIVEQPGTRRTQPPTTSTTVPAVAEAPSQPPGGAAPPPSETPSRVKARWYVAGAAVVAAIVIAAVAVRNRRPRAGPPARSEPKAR
jgi:hypothetical protein